MNLIDNVSAILTHNKDLDEIVYLPNKMSNQEDLTILDIDWKNIIPPPPKNSSDKTAKEIKIIYDATKSRTFREVDFVSVVDKNPNTLFIDYLEKKKLTFPIYTFNEYWNILEHYIYALKFHYNRARPEQIAPYYNVKIDVLYTDSHHTPAYPSGHTMYAALSAHILSDMYPEHKKNFFELAKYCGLARILQGVHYPSDNQAAMKATKILYQAIKRRFENEESKNFPLDYKS